MVRNAEALEGLALVGTARAGPLATTTPALIFPGDRPTPSGIPVIPMVGRPASGSGRRAFALGGPPAEWALEYTIPTPDLVSTGTEVQRVGAAAFVRGPLSKAALERLANEPPELVILSNARSLFLEGRPFVETVGALRRSVGAGPLVWAPRVATPNRIPFLIYVGIDLIDATESLVDAAEGRRADAELGFVEAGKRGLCECAECQGDGSDVPEAHALALLSRELRRSVAAIRQGRLRELVESRLPSEPRLGELLRYTDRLIRDLLEERAPVVGGGLRTFVIRESFQRPSARRFRERLIDRYTPPPSKGILLLVPCSKTKPYRNSRSHRRFASTWESLTGTERIHVVSITSPLGVVPRELEDMPPARHYDIPVTGDWDEAERAAVIAGVNALRKKGHYARVVAHLDPEEYGFLRPSLEAAGPVDWTLADDRTTGPEALATLHQTLEAALGTLPRSSGALRTVREELRAIAAFQFGPAAGGALLAEPIRLHGRPWFQRISDGEGRDLATWREERGLFHLTVAGGERIGIHGGCSVEIADGVDLRGDVFSPGVVRADPGIRAGDAVLLCRGGELLAVGEAALPGPLMGALGRGLAVEVRHRKGLKGAVDRSIEAPAVPDAGRSSSG